MSKIVISKFAGLNASQATLQLDKSDFTGVQNIRQRPFDNWVKRQGISFSTAQTSPIMGIFQVDLDNITIPFFQSGTALTFFPDLSTIDGTFTQPSPYAPTIPPISSARVVLFNVEQTMRAIQNRRIVGGVIETTWPNLIFRSDGTRYNGNTGIPVATYPATNLYSPDLTFFDAFYGFPAGTRAAQLVNAIIASCHNAVSVINWIKTISGVATVVHYDSTIFPALASTTPTNYRSNLTGCKTGIQKLISIEIGATQVQVERKSGTASDSVVCPVPPVSSVSISGYSDSFFGDGTCTDPFCVCNDEVGCSPPGCTVWNGSLIPAVDNCFWSVDGSADGLTCYSVSSGKPLFQVLLDYGFGAWTMAVTVCFDLGSGCGSDCPDSWIGEFVTSNNADPRGVYTQTGGCLSPASLTLV